MMAVSKLTSKGQTTIPADIRRALRLAEGDVLVFHVEGDTVRLSKQKSALDLAGVFFEEGRVAASVEDMNRAIDDARLERGGRHLDRR